ncbi:MAG: DUF3880 domain-containing protein [Lachnoclostridium sp.]|nr:DUF3880 domain-containing protein [Lachnospira sp.]MCM1247321.1 DUF3880 domain-containing protein [Lachnoclostridium sp.]MCM1534376.1 DUF3880 domain-containing protein [Clostridium sp.]
MTILFYRYGNICEPDLITAFQDFGITVAEETAEMSNKNLPPAKCVELVSHSLDTLHPLFVFSINFFPAVAEVCHLYKVLYLCWTVDSPVPELFSKSILHDTNRIFLFDKAQYDDFAPFNPDCIFHLPLASCTERFDKITTSISASERAKYNNDISFVGSLYTEKNRLRRLPALPDYISGYINGIVEASLKIYGYNFMEDILTDDIVNSIHTADSSFFSLENTVAPSERYVTAHEYIGIQAAETERIRTLNKLAEHFPVDLYTRSDPSPLKNVHVHGGIKTLTEMPKVFHLSKINLNMTIRPIQTGLPLRIFDILGCGGFLMTNYQPELTEHFEIGVDLEAYASLDELVDKCSYYLAHDSKRQKIAETGYQKVKESHTYQKRLTEMLRIVSG